MKYPIVYEKSPTGSGPYAPDLPGLGVVGIPLQGMRQLGDEIPVPSATMKYITILIRIT
jgi:hypothetical protein